MFQINGNILFIETLFAKTIELDFVCQIFAQNMARLFGNLGAEGVAICFAQLFRFCKK